jgi:beta-carotene ketolase (CrtO type)
LSPRRQAREIPIVGSGVAKRRYTAPGIRRLRELWANFAIREPPRYLAEMDNPGVGSQPRLYWGAKDLDYLHLRYEPEMFVGGFAKRPYVLCSVDSLWDRTRVPEGSHIVGVEEFSAPRRLFGSGEWRDIAQRFTENLLREWSRYAPNMTRDNIIASRVYTPDDVQRERPNMIEGGYSTGSTIASQTARFRPAPGIGGYRVLLDNVFDCSANLHSGPGIGRGSSYNCFREIARALNLEQPAVAA